MVLKILLPVRSGNLGVTSVSTALNVRGECLEHVSKDNKIVIVERKDNKKLIMTSNCCGTVPKVKVQRWSKPSRKYIEVSFPSVVKTYNLCMGVVDIYDQQIEC
ncbi:hypothetical protein NPIL_321351 [Nephila pilipes]|uniref:Uncharacterized protein n=1 Tax=Nephila pilipes TaxID=299642 RepID=A0A8X6TTL3_NEPPI|nr:hypothetical protein NPIL_321351 [Nephila pilipes]